MECTIGSLPSLTFQFMSDSGTVELSRDCGEEGTRHVQCHGQRGVEREHILGQLRCADESSSPTSAIAASTAAAIFETTADRRADESSMATADPTASSSSAAHGSDLTTLAAAVVNTEPSSARTEVLTFVHSNANEEDNSIAIDVSSLSRVHELMQADGPPSSDAEPIEKPQKPAAIKKVLAKDRMDKKPYSGKSARVATTKATPSAGSAEMLMMSDQPADVAEALAMEFQPLKDVKKMMKSDLHVRPTIQPAATTTVTTEASSTTETPMITMETTGRQRRETVEPHTATTIDELVATSTMTPPKSETATASWTSTSLSAGAHESHNASLNVDESMDHFIPPLLMVRSQFTSTAASTAAASTTTAPAASTTVDEVQSEATTTVVTDVADVVEPTTKRVDVDPVS